MGIQAFTSIFCIALMLAGCSYDDTPAVPSDPKTPQLLSRSIETATIDAETATYVATKFINAHIDGQNVTSHKTAESTITIKNGDGKPVMYAVNFGIDDGFVVVSASRHTSPIVASSDRGSYHAFDSAKLFIQRLIRNASVQITKTFDYPYDSVANRVGEWSALLPPKVHFHMHEKNASNSINTDSHYSDIINKAVAEWVNNGYDVYSAQDWLQNPSGNYKELPDLDKLLNKMNMPVNWADGIAMNQLCLIIVRHIITYTNSGEKCDPIVTKWHVNSPYNSTVPKGMPLSSEAVAVSQMLHYFKHSSILDFSASASNPLQNNTEIANFLYDVACNIYTIFGSTYSYAPYDRMMYALSSKYRYSYKTGEFNENEIIYSINNGSPSIVIEYDEDGRSHAWICDGYRYVSDRIDYFLMAPVGQPEDVFGPYESSGQWDEYGNASVQFNNSSDNIYFNTFFDPDSLDNFYGKKPIFIYKFSEDRKRVNTLIQSNL